AQPSNRALASPADGGVGLTGDFGSRVPVPLETDAVLHDAAIREDGRSSEIARAISGDEADDAGNFLRPRDTPKWYGRFQLGQLGWIIHCAEVDRCCHRTGTHPDDKDVVSGEFDTRGSGEHAHATLGQAVSGVARHWPI